MPLPLVLICIITAFFLFRNIRFLYKRILCAKKLRKICRNSNYNFHKTHPLWLLGGKNTQKCDCYIETPSEVFAIKLFGMPRRSTVLVFKANGEYFIRSFIAIISYGSAMRFPLNSKPKPMPTYNFRYKYRDECEIKTPRRVLLVNPVSMEFRRQPECGSEVLIGAGDIVNGMEIDSLPRLLNDLENSL